MGKFWDLQFFLVHCTQKLSIPQPIRPYTVPFYLLSISLSLSCDQEEGAWSLFHP